MSLEVYTGLIKDLVITNPTPTDPKSQGDDHLRGIKKTIFDDALRKSGDTMTGPLIVNANTTTDAVRITQTGTGNALVVENSAAVERLRIDSSGSIYSKGSTKPYGFHSEVAAAAGRWNFYAAGTADNYFAGAVQLGGGAQGNITAATNAGADTASVLICGGGSPSSSRGSFVQVFGNEHGTNAGNILLQAGAGATRLIKSVGGLEINKTAVTAPAATDGNVFSGTYTPTLTNVTNVAASSAVVCHYMRVGNVVTVSGRVNVTPTAAGNTQLRLSIPVPSNFTSVEQGSGVVGCNLTNDTAAGILTADATTDTMVLNRVAATTAASILVFNFTYRIL